MNMIAEFILIDNQFIPSARIDSIQYVNTYTDEENGHPEVKLPNVLVINYHSEVEPRELKRLTLTGDHADKLYTYLKLRSAVVSEL